MKGPVLISVVLLIMACGADPGDDEKRAVLAGYRQQAYAVYDDAHVAARALYDAIDRLIVEPSPTTLKQARNTWRAARVPYSQSEALRFGNWFTDEWEARVNAWPVDEGFIDYVDSTYIASESNPWARTNIIGSDSMTVRGREIPLRYIVAKQLRMLEAESDVEAIVATGYHAIEFMLWGQDSNPNGSGQRPWTDFLAVEGRCTNGPAPAAGTAPCRKRGEFLRATALLLMEYLQEMREHWREAGGSPGARLVAGDVDIGLSRMLFGLSAMSVEELAGERLRVALMTHAPEEEQDCFSDDTHHSLWYNAIGIENFYYGRYQGRSAVDASAHSLAALAERHYPVLAGRLDEAFRETRQALRAIRERGDSGEPFDRLIRADNPDGNALIARAVEALESQSALLGELAAKLGVPMAAPARHGDEAV